MNIRRATRNDLPALVALDRAVFGEMTYPGFFFRQALDLWPEWLQVAEIGRDISGYALGAAGEPGKAWLLSMAVLDTARGRGVGRALLEGVLEAMRLRHIKTVQLTVHPQNTAVHLYTAVGFRQIGGEADYFHVNDPRWLMALDLGMFSRQE